jgi:hypothetical protein
MGGLRSRRGRVFVVLGALCACGDNLERPAGFEATSGMRLKLEGYAYLDGSQQWDTTGFYDADLHARCTPRLWADDVLRCVPQSDETIFVDAACETLVGRTFAPEGEELAFYSVRTVVGTESRPSRLFRAGEPTDPPAQYYARDDTGCTGPFATPPGARYFAVGSEVTAVALESAEHGDGRLALRLYATADGLRAPIALHDRELAIDCRPSAFGEAVTCDPNDAPVAANYVDAGCTARVVSIAGDAVAPTVARVDADTCAAFYTTGAEHDGDIYVLDRGFCIRVPRVASRRYLTVTGAAPLATLSMSVDFVDDRRLQPMWLDADGLFAAHDRLFDIATRAECVDRTSAGLTRCLPASTVAAPQLYRRGCTSTVRAVVLPKQLCVRPAFATVASIDPDDVPETVHSIQGEYTGGELAQLDVNGICHPVVAGPDEVVHALGPPLPDDAFVAGVPFGAR